MAPCTKQRCCDIIACRDTSCGCCLPKSTGDARRLMWIGGFLALLAVVFILIALFVPSTINNAFERTLEESPIITPNSGAFLLFEDNSKFPMKLEVYMYNVTNPAAALDGATPSLQEIGPFVYWVYRTLDPSYEFTENNSLLAWKYYERYIFDEELSVASDTVRLYQSNMPFWGVVSSLMTQQQYALIDYFVSSLKQPGQAFESEVNMAFTYRAVHEHLFGYSNDPLLNLIHDKMPSIISNVYNGIMTNYTSMEDMSARLLYNDQISTGADSRKRARQYVQYRGSTTVLDMDRIKCPWASEPTDDHCLIRGIDGGATLPIDTSAKREDLSFEFFYPSLFRHVNFVNTWKYTEENVDFYRFRFDEKEWKSGDDVEYNKAYGMVTEGVIPLGPAVSNSPLSNTRPRQLGIKDEAWKATVDLHFLEDGKRDEGDKYSMDTHFDFERQTGSTLRFQSTSELVVTVKKIEFDYDPDEMRIQSQPVELSSIHDELSVQDQKQFTATLHEMFNDLDTFHQTGEWREAAEIDSQSVALAQTSPGCTFAPSKTAPHCMGKISQFLQANRQYYQTSDQLTSQQEPNDMKHVAYFEKLAVAHAPLFWANQTGGISAGDLHTLGAAFKAVNETIKILPIVCFVVAIILLLLAAFFLIRGSKFQSQIRKDLNTFEEHPQDGDLPDNERHKTGEGHNYAETLDALDLDPIYSNDYNHRSTAASSAHIHGNVRQSQNLNRSVSTLSTSNKKNMSRIGSMQHINTQGQQNYGGVELKNNR